MVGRGSAIWSSKVSGICEATLTPKTLADMLMTREVPLPEIGEPDLEWQEESARPSVAPVSPDQLRVLIVDDNRVNRSLVERMITRMGHVIEGVENGQLAVKAVAGGAYDLVFMDLHMPVMGGLEAAEAIRALPGAGGRTYIAAMTAAASTEDRTACQMAGMNDFITKPITFERVSEAVERAAEYRKQNAPAAAETAPTAPAPLETTPAETVASLVTAWAPAPAPRPDQPALDQRVIGALRRELGAEALGELMAMFTPEAAELLLVMEQAVREGDRAQIKTARHTIKGMAASLGAAAVLRALEGWNSETAAEELGAPLARLTVAIARTSEEIRLIADVSPERQSSVG